MANPLPAAACPTDDKSCLPLEFCCPDQGGSSEMSDMPMPMPTARQTSSSTTSRPADDCASENPVRYGDGSIIIPQYDLKARGYNKKWPVERFYNNLYANDSGFIGSIGNGWGIDSFPVLTTDDAGVTIKMFREQGTIQFSNRNGTTGYFVTNPASDQKLRYNGADQSAAEYQMSDRTGWITLFHDFSASVPAGRQGKIKGFISPARKMWRTNYDAQDRLIRVAVCQYINGSITCSVGVSTPVFNIGWTTVGGDRIEFITQGLDDGQGGFQSLRRIQYVYYDGVSDTGNGSAGDLKLVKFQRCTANCGTGTPTWTDWMVAYYRYYTGDSATGFRSGLKYVLSPEAYQRCKDGNGGTAPENLADAQIAPYADFYFEYFNSTDVNARRCSKERRFGTGTGSLSFTYTYYTRAGAPQTDYNQWQRKTTETLPDGNQNIVYTNFLGQVVLKHFKSSTKNWYEFYEYDNGSSSPSRGKVLRKYMPSAVASYSQTGDGALSVTLNSSAGLVYENAYFTSADPAPGYLKYQGVKNGSAGTLIKVREYEYEARGQVDYPQVYLMTKETLYLTDTNQGLAANQAVTTFTNQMHLVANQDTAQLSQKTTTLPTVDFSTQNGSGATATRIENFDVNGYRTQLQDERGVKTRWTWYIEQALITKLEENYVTGTPGPGQNITTDFQYDDFGRVTKVLGPAHKIIDASGVSVNVRAARWIIYDEPNFERREGIGYQRVSDSSEVLVNPVRIYRFDRANRVKEVIAAKRGNSVESSGALVATDAFVQDPSNANGWARWTVLNFDNQSKLSYHRLYHQIPASGLGTSGTNYNQTDLGYSALRLLNRVKTGGATIHRAVYDARRFETEYWMGTNDNGATDNDPSGSSSSSNNMVIIRKNVWDANADRLDGNISQVSLYQNSSTTRPTDYTYDWRDRRITRSSQVSATENLYEAYQYDTQDRPTIVERRKNNSGGALVFKRQVDYDKRGRVFRRTYYPASGVQTLVEKLWYDEGLNVIKRAAPESSAFEKRIYDNLGRVLKRYFAYGTDSTYSQVQGVSTNVIMRQAEFAYDDASNLLQAIERHRYDNAGSTVQGELTSPTGADPKGRVTYRAYWPDSIDRLRAWADYGTYGTSSWSRPDTIPASKDIDATPGILVTKLAYDVTGELFSRIAPVDVGPVNQETRLAYDHAARVTQLIENYVSGGSNPDQNKTTNFAYNGDSRLKQLAAVNSTTGDQVTQWIYGTTLSDSDVASNDLVRQKIYPDSIGSADRVYFEYNRQYELRKMTDQAGTIHSYDYDKLGRLLNDRVPTLASGLDGAVRRLSATYSERGLTKLTSWTDPNAGSVVNEVELVYNEFLQITEDRQSHSGVVVAGTTMQATYRYENGSANNVRLNRITYPNSTLLDILFGTAAGQNDLLSRVQQLQWGGTVVTDYKYVGVDQFVQVQYGQPSIRWNLAAGTGNYPYTGLDQFDRVLVALWQYYGTPAADREKVTYAFNLANNRKSRQNGVQTTGQDEKYTYDGLFQLKTLDRGTLSGGSIINKSFAQDWTFDPTGNWTQFRQDDTGGGTWNINQSRTHNTVNEIATIAGSSTNVGFDGPGNMTKMPKADDWSTNQVLIYDAWNRIAWIKKSDAVTNVAGFEYDGFNRRTVKKAYNSLGTLIETRHYFYSLTWQVLEERTGTSLPYTLDRQFVWGLRYPDDLVLRERPGLSERLYALHDYFHVRAIVNTSGTAVERYGYTGYGSPKFMDGNFGARSSSSYGWETLFGAYRYDADTGLYQVRFRYLHPGLGRWLHRDPIAEYSGTSLYSYLGNNPLNIADPLGLWNASNLVKGGLGSAAALALLGIAAAATSPIIIVAAGVGAGVAGALALTNLAAGAFTDRPINIPKGAFSLTGQIIDRAVDDTLPEEMGPAQEIGEIADLLSGIPRVAAQWSLRTGAPGFGRKKCEEMILKSTSPPSPIKPPITGPFPKPDYSGTWAQ